MSSITLNPMRDGDSTQLSRIGTSFNWQAVLTNDSSTTELYSNSSSYLLDLYRFSPITKYGIISSVVVYARACLSSPYASGPNLKFAIKLNGNTYYSTEQSVIYSSFNYFSATWTTNPDTGEQWKISDIADIQAGIAMKYANSSNYNYCTHVYITVNYINEKEFSTTNIRPDSAGDLTQLTPTASPNWQCVNEEVLDVNDYVYNPDAITTKTDLYGLTSVSLAGQRISHIQLVVVVYHYKVTPIIKLDGNTYDCGYNDYRSDINNRYTTYSTWGNNPSTGLPWLDSDLANLQAGIILTSTSNPAGYCAMLYVVVYYYSDSIQHGPQLIGLLS